MVERAQKRSHEVVKGNIGKLGVAKEEEGILFRVAIKEAEPCSLLLYKKGTDEIEMEIPLEGKRVLGDIYAIKVKGLDYRKYEYNYRIGKKVIQDPYAKVIIGRNQYGQLTANGDGHQIRCGFDFSSYDWQGDAPLDIPFESAVMYGLHVRGFTMQVNSKVRHKGTFRGVSEKAQYLKDLGINQVKLMPAYEFDEIIQRQMGMSMNYKEKAVSEKLNFWGYGDGWYFAPKASYAAGSDPVKEMKDMIRTLHQYGIEVLMEFCFTKECSLRMVSDCLLHWITEYHIDGFHVMGTPGFLIPLAKDPMFTQTKLLGEYFPEEEIYMNGRRPIFRNLGEYNDGFLQDTRKLLKGDEKQLDSFVYRIRRNPGYCGVINYMVNHNGFTLADLVSYNEKHNEENGEQNQDGLADNFSWNCGIEGPSRRKKVVELRNRQMRNAFLMMLLASGTPMIQAGDEIGNSQGGNNNPYCLDNETSWVDWRAARRNAGLTEFVRETVSFRQRHKILHKPVELTIMDTLSCGYPDLSYHGNRAWYGGFENGNRQIGIMYCGQYAGEDNFIYVAYNLHWAEHEFALPHLPEEMVWHTAIDTSYGVYQEGEEPVLDVQKVFQVPERTIIVLIGRKDRK